MSNTWQHRISPQFVLQSEFSLNRPKIRSNCTETRLNRTRSCPVLSPNATWHVSIGCFIKGKEGAKNNNRSKNLRRDFFQIARSLQFELFKGTNNNLVSRKRNNHLFSGPEKGGEISSSSDLEYIEQEADWLRKSFAEKLKLDGHGIDVCENLSRASGEALSSFLQSGYPEFDPLVLMDALEEGIERRGERGDFLPFEASQKATKLLCERWKKNKQPIGYVKDLKENTLDLVDLNSMPKTKQKSSIPPIVDDRSFEFIDADALVSSNENPPTS